MVMDEFLNAFVAYIDLTMHREKLKNALVRKVKGLNFEELREGRGALKMT